MPPKKKPGSGKKKAKKSASQENNAVDLELIENYTKCQVQLDVFEKELEHRNDQMNRLKQQVAEQRLIIQQLEAQLDERSKERVDLTSDMSRQFKTMQAEMASKIIVLETENIQLKEKLATVTTELQEAKESSAKLLEQKDSTIEDQQVKMSYMSNEFEHMLNDTLSKMTKKLETVSLRWKETEGIKLSEQNQKRLADFQIMRTLI